MLNRRELLSSTASLLVAAGLPFAARADTTAQTSPALDKLFDDFFQENLRLNPEGATLLGLDTGANADLKSKLRDESAAGIAAAKALNADQLRRLKAFDAGALAAWIG
jgi:uncharacterized protein (DUF885 family)